MRQVAGVAVKATAMDLRLLKPAFLTAAFVALWAGCSSDPIMNGTQGVSGDPNGEDAGEEPKDEDEDEGDGEGEAGTVKKDAGTKDAGKKDSGATKPDASAPDANVADANACWPFPCATDGGGTDAAPTDASTAACNTVPVAVVAPKAISGFQPMTGGTVIDGTYKLIASTRYINGTSNTTFPTMGEGVEIDGSTLKLRITAPGFGSSVSYNYTFTTSGYTMTLTRTCPSAASATWTYHVDGNKLVLYGLPPSNGTWYHTFEKQ